MSKMYYTFLVDTTAYSGNFEREMTGYMTGVIGDCGVGNRFADMFNEEIVVDADCFDPGIVLQRPDEDHGDCYRPCAIAPTPGYVNNGSGKHFKSDSREAKRLKNTWPAYQSVAIFFTEDPTPHIEFLKERAQKYVEIYNAHGNYGDRQPREQIEIISFRLERSVETTETISGEFV